MIIRQALQSASELLSSLPSPYLDSMLLLCNALGMKKEQLLASLPDPCPEEEYARFTDMVEKRRTGVPVAYITGRKEFWGLDFTVGPGVLIPRPDTEILVETALDLIDDKQSYSGSLLDLCTGSGCIAGALARELPEADIWASDLYDDALKFAKLNLSHHAPRVSLVKSDLFAQISNKFDIVVTNPPYIADTEYDSLEKDVHNEPRTALTSGHDGLAAIHTLIMDSVERILPNGYLCIEAAPSQAAEIRRLLEKSGFTGITHKKDLSGRIRVTLGQRRK